MKGLASVVAVVAMFLVNCSGDVEVHGIPETIQLQAPFCVPITDAGAKHE